MDIDGTAALVTGGASGLGAATARRLASAGSLVTIVDLNAEAGEALASDLGNGARFVAGDVTSADDMEAAVELAGVAAPLRIAVNCAGIGLGERTIDRDGRPADLARFTRVVTINLIGTYNTATRAAAAMSKTTPVANDERGVIINTASVAAFEGQIGQTAYSASKGGVVGLTVPMARDLSSVGVRVVTIAPGVIDTPLLGGLNEDMRTALASSVPFPKRLGTPDDYADLVLAIVRNGYLNGETIRLDGALRMAPR
ncbi:MAG: SDR family NAD(P)-dependent oxidoreductase [Acidimicrobiia bacterium]